MYALMNVDATIKACCLHFGQVTESTKIFHVLKSVHNFQYTLLKSFEVLATNFTVPLHLLSFCYWEHDRDML
jgi:hypothetical protein